MADPIAPLAAIATPIIAAVGVVVAAIVTAVITYSTTKRRERESELRKEKLEHYKEFMGTLSLVMSGDFTHDDQKSFARACNKLNLIAPQSVIEALQAYQAESGAGDSNAATARRKTLMSLLLHAMRVDLNVVRSDDDPAFVFSYWAVSALPVKKR